MTAVVHWLCDGCGKTMVNTMAEKESWTKLKFSGLPGQAEIEWQHACLPCAKTIAEALRSLRAAVLRPPEDGAE